MSDAFDPFDLPSSFDPFGSEAPPPPRRRAAPKGQGQPPPPAGDPSTIGAGGRLAHLLPHAGRPSVPGGGPDATAARLQALEDEITILTARLEAIEATFAARLQDQHFQTLQAVAALIDERLGRRG